MKSLAACTGLLLGMVLSAGAATIYVDVERAPVFVLPPHDPRLKRGSPAVDAGTPATPLLTDLYGNPRLMGVAVDIGSYEVTPPAGTLVSLR